MVALSGFSASQQELLVRLPYRVGVWISESDDVGGADADAQEIQVLQALIVAYVQDFCKTEFVQVVMEETVAQKDKWETWHGDIDQILDECRSVMEFLDDSLSQKEIAAFRDNLIEIGYSVAMAYCELNDETSLVVKVSTYLGIWIEKIRRALTGAGEKAQEEYLNISALEQKALDELVQALSLRHNIDVVPEGDIVENMEVQNGKPE
jgi:hypothetical protein